MRYPDVQSIKLNVKYNARDDSGTVVNYLQTLIKLILLVRHPEMENSLNICNLIPEVTYYV